VQLLLFLRKDREKKGLIFNEKKGEMGMKSHLVLVSSQVLFNDWREISSTLTAVSHGKFFK
jgi:hypothetical protein